MRRRIGQRVFSSFACIHGDAVKEKTYHQVPHNFQQCALLFTDPPYFILNKRRVKGDLRQDKTSNNHIHAAKTQQSHHLAVTPKFDSFKDYQSFTYNYLVAALPILHPSAVIAIWTNPAGIPAILNAAQQLGFSQVLNELRWIKPKQAEIEPTFPISIDRFQTHAAKNELSYICNESVLVLSRDANAVQTSDQRLYVTHSIMYDEHDEHPYRKPFDVLKPIIEQYSRPDDVVLDPFAGSGSIGSAALRCSRRSLNVEIKTEWLHNCFRSLESIIK